jgi:hypothetical protein
MTYTTRININVRLMMAKVVVDFESPFSIVRI